MMNDPKAALHDIYGTWYIPFWQRTSFQIAVVIVFLFILLLLGWLVIAQMRKRKKVVPYWQQSLDKLSSLHYLDCATRENGTYFYVVMTDTLKAYLHERYGLDVRSKTDEELISLLKEYSFDPVLVEELTDIFSGSVLIKFAKEQAIKTQVDRHLVLGLSFIKKTMPSSTVQRNQ